MVSRRELEELLERYAELNLLFYSKTPSEDLNEFLVSEYYAATQYLRVLEEIGKIMILDDQPDEAYISSFVEAMKKVREHLEVEVIETRSEINKLLGDYGLKLIISESATLSDTNIWYNAYSKRQILIVSPEQYRDFIVSVPFEKIFPELKLTEPLVTIGDSASNRLITSYEGEKACIDYWKEFGVNAFVVKVGTSEPWKIELCIGPSHFGLKGTSIISEGSHNLLAHILYEYVGAKQQNTKARGHIRPLDYTIN